MSSKITFTEVVAELAEANGITKEQSNEFITNLVDYVLDETRDKGKSAITNFGSFNVVNVAARTGINPRTGEEIVIPEHKRLSFTPYKALEKSVNQEFAELEASVVDANEVPVTEEEPAIEEEPEATTLTPDEDPFEEIINAEEDGEEITLDEETESSSTENAYRYPGRPERKSTNMSPMAIIGVLVVLAIAVVGIWFFTIRDTPPISASSTAVQTNDSQPDENTSDEGTTATATTDDEEVYDEESRVIPMVQDDVDLSEIPNESRTIENSTPIIQDIPATFVTTYSVSSGVWIYEIARQTYGNTRLWPLIFQANYTISNNPDLILPNIVLNIPELEGTADNPSTDDYVRLAEAARYVSQAYQMAGDSTQAQAYIKAADWYETMR